MPVAQWKPISGHFKMVFFGAAVLAQKAREEIGTDHLLLAIDYQNGPLWRAILRDTKVDAAAFRSHTESFVDAHSEAKAQSSAQEGLSSKAVTEAIGAATIYGQQRGGTTELNIGTLLLALANEKRGRIEQLLEDYGINVATFRSEVERNLIRETDEL